MATAYSNIENTTPAAICFSQIPEDYKYETQEPLNFIIATYPIKVMTIDPNK